MRNHSLSLRHFLTHTLVCSAALAALLPAVAAAAAQESYTGCSVPEAEAEVCPALIGLGPDNDASGISADGRVIVGEREGLPAAWTERGDLVPLGGFPLDIIVGRATAASRDGSVIVGQLIADSSTAYEPFRWEADAVELLPIRRLWHNVVRDVSGDGRKILGAFDGLYGWIWEDGDWELLTGTSYGAGKYGSAMSDDGSVIVGSVSLFPAIWVDGEMQFLIEQDMLSNSCWDPSKYGGTVTCGGASGVSSDGSIIVGRVHELVGDHIVEPPQAAMWRGGAEYQLLGYGPFVSTSAYDVSADGSVVVGSGGVLTNPGDSWRDRSVAMLWTEVDGVRSLAEVLEDAGVTTTDWKLQWSRAVSDDGRIVVGEGEFDGTPEGFIADFSPPIGIDIVPGSDTNAIELARDRFVSVQVFGTQLLDVDDIDVDALAFGPDAASVEHVFQPRDANDDGYLDLEVRFETGETGIAAGDTEACLSGRAMGMPFEVCGPIEAALFGFGSGAEVPGCGRGFEGALALPALLLWWRRRSRGACHGKTWR